MHAPLSTTVLRWRCVAPSLGLLNGVKHGCHDVFQEALEGHFTLLYELDEKGESSLATTLVRLFLLLLAFALALALHELNLFLFFGLGLFELLEIGREEELFEHLVDQVFVLNDAIRDLFVGRLNDFLGEGDQADQETLFSCCLLCQSKLVSAFSSGAWPILVLLLASEDLVDNLGQ